MTTSLRGFDFNPLPRKRENLLGNGLSFPEKISIHSLVRGRTALVRIGTAMIVYFNPLPRKRENYVSGGKFNPVSNFNPLPRKRENLQTVITFAPTEYFNPLPRKRENAQPHPGAVLALKISIHSLVRGRTFFCVFFVFLIYISIHSLVRGRTIRPPKLPSAR